MKFTVEQTEFGTRAAYKVGIHDSTKQTLKKVGYVGLAAAGIVSYAIIITKTAPTETTETTNE